MDQNLVNFQNYTDYLIDAIGLKGLNVNVRDEFDRMVRPIADDKEAIFVSYIPECTDTKLILRLILDKVCDVISREVPEDKRDATIIFLFSSIKSLLRYAIPNLMTYDQYMEHTNG